MSGENYILFLKLGREIPDLFYHLSDHLSKVNISLLPIEPNELAKLSNGHLQNLLVHVPDILSQARYRKVRKQFLDFALVGKKFSLFEITSFAPIEIAGRLRRQGLYNHFKLPVALERVLRPIVLSFYNQSREIQKWPGGRRAKLPNMS